MVLENLEVEKSQLIEELGVYFEKCDGLSPLSARIFAMLVLSDQGGVTFEEFIEKLEASKSSISTNLQLLQTAGSVCYGTKPGDRKRYFKIVPDHILLRLDKKIEMWEKEKNLHLKIYAFKEHYFLQPDKENTNFHSFQYPKFYASFIDDVIDNLTYLKKQLEKTINNEPS